MPNSHTLPADPALGVMERPRCKYCQARMNMAGIAPGLTGYELCMFECFSCHYVQRTLVVIDPVSGDARKWLKGQFKPPNEMSAITARCDVRSIPPCSGSRLSQP